MPKKCLSLATKRTHNYRVYLSEIELDWLRIKAADAGMSASELIRRLTLGKPLPKRLSKISQATYIELRRIGNNLNQLTKATNTAIKAGYSPPTDPKLLAELRDLLHQCRRQLAGIDETGDISDDDFEECSDDWEAEER